ncbi:MAG: glycosyltransferase involved in cell wall biosynthesis [Paraglaciecola sp.]|jgi:glycosyltransferase involved in cell wall biosynthesis
MLFQFSLPSGEMMDVKMPTVSVVLPVFNAAAYLPQCIESILKQSYDDFELIIVDDGSCDSSLLIMYEYAQKDDRIIIVKNRENQGLISVLNNVVILCKGKYIARMDADDWSEPNRLATQVDYLDKHDRVAIVGSWIRLFGQKNETWHYRQHDEFIKALLLFKTNGFPHNSIICRKFVFEKFKYNVSYPYIEDTELWIRIMLDAPRIKFANIPIVLTHYRISDNQTSAKHKVMQDDGYIQIITNILQRLVPGVTEAEINIHFAIINGIVPKTKKELIDMGCWVCKLSGMYNNFLPDSFAVIAEKWGLVCLRFTKRKFAYQQFIFFKPREPKFTFLFEKNFIQDEK